MHANYVEHFTYRNAARIAAEVERVRRIIPLHYHDFTTIAGGFVAEPFRANDIDVWVSIEEGDFPKALGEVMAAIKHSVYTTGPARSIQWAKGAVVHDGVGDEGYTLRGFFVVATIHEEGKRPIQLILTDRPSGDTIISSFDLSCHAVGVGLVGGEVYKHPLFSSPWNGPGSLLDLTTPLHTLGRYLKLAQRYLWTVDAGFTAPLLAKLQPLPDVRFEASTDNHNNLAQNVPELHENEGMGWKAA